MQNLLKFIIACLRKPLHLIRKTGLLSTLLGYITRFQLKPFGVSLMNVGGKFTLQQNERFMSFVIEHKK